MPSVTTPVSESSTVATTEAAGAGFTTVPGSNSTCDLLPAQDNPATRAKTTASPVASLHTHPITGWKLANG